MKVGIDVKKFNKITALVLSAILIAMSFAVFSLAAVNGDVNNDGDVTAIDARMILQVAAGLLKETELENAENADVSGDGKISAVDARMILQIAAGLDTPEEPKPDEPTPEPLTKAKCVELFNAETTKASKGNYSWTRNCKYIRNLSVSGAPASAIQSIVDSFLGIGTNGGTQADAGKYGMIGMSLTESDIKDFQATDEQIVLLLNDSTNPEKENDSSFVHVSNDFVTKKDVEDQIAAAGVGATLTEFSAKYYDVKVVADLDKDGNPASLKISYKLEAKIGAKMGFIKASGDGAIETEIVYSDLVY